MKRRASVVASAKEARGVAAAAGNIQKNKEKYSNTNRQLACLLQSSSPMSQRESHISGLMPSNILPKRPYRRNKETRAGHVSRMPRCPGYRANQMMWGRALNKALRAAGVPSTFTKCPPTSPTRRRRQRAHGANSHPPRL